MVFLRNCPDCDVVISHTTKQMRDRAVKKNQKCMSCARKKKLVVTDSYSKYCPLCLEDKPAKDYNKHSKSSDGLQGWCRTCGNKKSIDYYFAHKGSLEKSSKLRQGQLRQYLDEAKSKPCKDCGGTFDPICMDFDHLPEFEKTEDIAEMYRRRMSWSAIQEEIAKCDLICSNCHRIRTRDRLLMNRSIRRQSVAVTLEKDF